MMFKTKIRFLKRKNHLKKEKMSKDSNWSL